jgi:hypothetical protein
LQFKKNDNFLTEKNVYQKRHQKNGIACKVLIFNILQAIFFEKILLVGPQNYKSH